MRDDGLVPGVGGLPWVTPADTIDVTERALPEDNNISGKLHPEGISNERAMTELNSITEKLHNEGIPNEGISNERAMTEDNCTTEKLHLVGVPNEGISNEFAVARAKCTGTRNVFFVVDRVHGDAWPNILPGASEFRVLPDAESTQQDHEEYNEGDEANTLLLHDGKAQTVSTYADSSASLPAEPIKVFEDRRDENSVMDFVYAVLEAHKGRMLLSTLLEEARSFQHREQMREAVKIWRALEIIIPKKRRDGDEMLTFAEGVLEAGAY